MTKREKITKKGQVIKALPSASFEVRLEDGNMVIARLSGNMRRFRIKTLPGDTVKVELSPYYPGDKKGRIIWRKNK